jgi:hypothetical protein
MGDGDVADQRLRGPVGSFASMALICAAMWSNVPE